MLGGVPTQLALDLRGRHLRYDELTTVVAETAAALAATDTPLLVAETDPATVLVRCLAAFTVSRPVVVADPHQPRAELPALVPGTELAVTTSGSTGRPRLVCRTLSSWYSSFPPFSQLTGIGADDVVALTGPVQVSLQLFGALHALHAGATVTDDLGPATVAHLVPSTLNGLLRAGTAPRRAVVAGASSPDALIQRAVANGVNVVEYYGATELSLVAMGRPGTLTPFPGAELQVRNQVIWVRSPYLSLGYAGAPGQLRRTDDGFATVGDRGKLANGVLSVQGRAESAVTTAGVTVLVDDVEAALTGASGVRAVAVVGMPHPRLGSLLVAVVEADEPVPEQTTQALRRHAREQLPPAARPRLWFIGNLPRTAGGKIDRPLLQRWITDGSPQLRRLA